MIVGPPSNTLLHHWVLGDPVQMLKFPPPLKECNTTNPMGKNKNTSTSTVNTASATRSGSGRRSGDASSSRLHGERGQPHGAT